MSTAHTTYEIQESLAVLTFNRPEARNAMTWEMYDALLAACEDVDRDPAIRVLILRGAGGKAFIAGTDIAQFEGFRSAQDGVEYERRLDDVLDRLERVTKPTIAQVQGVAAGGGCAIALCCDLRVATPESTFGVPIARTLGNCLSMASYSRLVYLVGAGLVKDIVFRARLIEADEALAKGLINELSDDQRLMMQRAEEITRLVASHAPLTLQATKEALLRLRPSVAHGEGNDLVLMCYMSQDFREGMDAFLNKRKPVWKGK